MQLMSWLPLALSVAALAIWPLVFGGIIVHWRSGRTMPTGVVAALMIAVTGGILSRLIGAAMYAEPTLVLSDDTVLASAIHRGLLVMTGLWALALLVRSRRRW